MTHTSEDNHICIVGLGYVGLTLAVAMDEAGFQVSGVERNAAVAAIIRSGRAHFSEEGLDAPLAKAPVWTSLVTTAGGDSLSIRAGS